MIAMVAGSITRLWTRKLSLASCEIKSYRIATY